MLSESERQENTAFHSLADSIYDLLGLLKKAKYLRRKHKNKITAYLAIKTECLEGLKNNRDKVVESMTNWLEELEKIISLQTQNH